MDAMFIPRPEDFRLAWPNAYSQAMRLAVDIQRCNGVQIDIVKMVIQDCGAMSNRTIENIRKTGYVYIDEMRKAGLESKKSIHDATGQLVRSMNASLASNREIRDDIRAAAKKLLQERQQIEKLKLDFNSRPLWKRLWLAFLRKY